MKNKIMPNQALHIDRKGRGLIVCCSFCVSGACRIACHPLAASELDRYARRENAVDIVMRNSATRRTLERARFFMQQAELVATSDRREERVGKRGTPLRF
jgi:hypothetical protein